MPKFPRPDDFLDGLLRIAGDPAASWPSPARPPDPEGTFDIYGMKLRAGDPELRLIVTDGVLPFWSPDGRHLIDPGQLHRQPVGSPDGDSLCFISRMTPLPHAPGE